jgi:hypothetical protein
MTNSETTMRRLLPIVLTVLLAGCGAATPAQQAAESVEDAADARATTIRQTFDNSAAEIRTKADQLREQAKSATDFDQKVLKTRAEALDREADLVRQHGQDKAEAERAQGQAQAKTIKSQ